MDKLTRKKKLGGYPAVGVVFSITLALLAIGLFGGLIMYSRGMAKYVKENIRLQVFLTNQLTETQRLQIENKLFSTNFVNKENGRGINFISKDEAAKKFIEETGEDFIKFLGENPLRDAYLVNIDPAFHSKEGMQKIKTDIENMKGVFQVDYNEDLIVSVNKNFRNIGLFLLGLTVILIFTVILLIHNTLRLALFSQRFLIRSMQLVGAKKWFIQKPFLFRAAGYGLLSGVIASIILWGLSNYAQRKIEDLTLLYNQNQFITILGFLLAAGITVAVAGTYFTIRKYLRMSLDELY